MLYFIITLNMILGFIITSVYYPIVGIAVSVFNGAMLTIGCQNALGAFFVRSQMKNLGNKVDKIVFSEDRLLMSITCLVFSLKIGAIITVFVETSAIFIIAFCILLASGYLFQGPLSGMTLISSYKIASLIFKIFSLLSIGFDKIAEWIAKAELRILNIEI